MVWVHIFGTNSHNGELVVNQLPLSQVHQSHHFIICRNEYVSV